MSLCLEVQVAIASPLVQYSLGSYNELNPLRCKLHPPLEQYKIAEHRGIHDPGIAAQGG